MKINHLAAIGVLSLALAACGGGSSGSGNNPPPPGPQSTSITAAGKITGFGSIYVNGIEFETDGASYDVDDMAGSSDSDFSVGMNVVVKGTVNADGVTGSAASVYYDDEVEGPVEGLGPNPSFPTDATMKVFFVLGTEVWIDSSTNFDSEDGSVFGFDTIINGDNVEVSGDWVGDVLNATYVELQDPSDDDYEVEGTVSAYQMDNGSGQEAFTLILDNGATLNVTVASGADVPAMGIMDDQYVEVEGTIPDPVALPDDLLATKVELEDQDDFDSDDDEAEKKGPLSLSEVDGSWSINGTMIVFGPSTEYSPETLEDAIADGSAHGREVEVEGHYIDGALHADEVKDEEDDLEFKAVVSAKPVITDAKNGTITLSFGTAGTLDVVLTGGTMYMDDDAVTPFDLNTLPLDTIVEIHAHHNAAGDVEASELEIEDSMSYKIQGPVDEILDTSISILGVVFTIDPMTTLISEPAPVAGDHAEVEDNNADGTADSVEKDD